jgi:carbonic anhydrase
MSTTDEVLQANEQYARDFTLGHLSAPPTRKLAVVTCMDARMDLEVILGLKPGEANIIRNAGGIVTEDVLRTLIISHHILFTQEFMLVHHTDCGLMAFRDEELRSRLQQTTSTASVAPHSFYTFTNVEESVRLQIQKLRSHPWVPKHISIRGFVYDVRTGRLNEVYV